MPDNRPRHLRDETPDFSSGGSTQSALLQNLENERDPMLNIDDDYEVEVVEARVHNHHDADELPAPEGEADAVAALAQELHDVDSPVAEAITRAGAARAGSRIAARRNRQPSPIPGMIKKVVANPIFIAVAVVVIIIGGLLTAALTFSGSAQPAIVETTVLDSQGVEDALLKAAALESKGDYRGALRTLQTIEVNAPEGLHPETLASDIDRLQHLAKD